MSRNWHYIFKIMVLKLRREEKRISSVSLAFMPMVGGFQHVFRMWQL